MRAALGILLTLTTFGGPCLTGCASNNKNAETAALHLKIGTALFTNKRFPAALTEFLTAEKLDPNNAVIQNNLALTYFVRDRYDLAQKHIDRAVVLKPDYTEARNNRARILIERGQFTESIAESQRVLKDLTYPSPARGWSNLALAYFRKGDYVGAKSSATEALKIDRANCFAQTILGRAHLELSELKESAETLDRAIVACKAEGEDEAAYFAGVAHYKQGRSAAATARLQEVVRDYPNGRFSQKAKSLLDIMR